MFIFKFGLSFVAWAIPVLWQICLSIDALIYEIADQVLRAFFQIAELSVNIENYGEEVSFIMYRVMVLAGVFALFRLAIMLINYLIDPNKASEVSKNGPQIIKNIMLALILLMTSNWIFGILGDFQRLVIEQSVIPKIVYGPENYENSEFSIEESSTRFVNRVFLIFFQEKSVDCAGSNRSSHYCKAYNDVKNGQDGTGISSLVPYASSDYFEYKPFISGIFGIVLVYYFFIFAIELGTRIIKLVILQVVSPIPIIMSMDPSQKDKLKNFVKVYMNIYLQLFIRIITVYLAFVVAGLVVSSDFGVGTINSAMLLDGTTWFVDLLLYIGIFHAAKEIPKLIEDSLGLKLTGSMGGKSFGGILKGIVGGSVGLLGGAVAGGIAGGIGGAVVGAGSGMVSGGLGVAASKNAAAGIKETINSIKGSYAKGGRVNNVGGLLPYMSSGVSNFFGGQRRDAATLKSFEAQTGQIDKSIAEHNTNIEGLNKQMEIPNKKMQIKSEADQLRSGIQGALDRGFTSSDPRRRSLDSYMQGDARLQELQSGMAQAEAAGAYSGTSGFANRQNDMSMINARKAELAKEYEMEKSRYEQAQFSAYRENMEHKGETDYVPKSIDAEFESALNEYNEYVESHDMANRKIGYAQEIGYNQKAFESEKQAIQVEIDQIQSQIKAEQMSIESEQRSKESVERSRKDFENRRDVQARKGNNESNPRVKPRKL